MFLHADTPFRKQELYSANGSLEHSYLMKTRSVLRYMATIGEEMEKVIDVKFRSSFDTITRAATHLRLLYHQVNHTVVHVHLGLRMADRVVSTVRHPCYSPSASMSASGKG